MGDSLPTVAVNCARLSAIVCVSSGTDKAQGADQGYTGHY